MDKKLIFEIFKELVEIDTTNPPGNEKRAAEYLYNLFDENGIKAEIQDLGNGNANLIASYGEKTPEIIFCGHLDVVPVSNDWNYPPFCLTKVGERLYGRGSSDMKAGIAAMSATIIELAKSKASLNGKLTLVFVADEEGANLGMKHFLEKPQDALFAVIGEPTELQVAVSHRGVLRDYIDVLAQPYHAALPAKQCNALQNAAETIMSFFQLNE